MTQQTKSLIRNVIGHLCAVGVAGFFLYAAHSKIIQPRQFLIDIRNYHLLPERYLNLAALFLPWLEATAAVALIVPRTRRAGSILVGGLLLMFIAAIAYAALYMGYDISCGCTGRDSSKAGWWTIIRNIGLLAGTGLSIWLPSKRPEGARGFDVMTAEPSRGRAG